MSRLSIYRPTDLRVFHPADEVDENSSLALADSQANVLSFAVEGRQLRTQAQYQLARRARLLKRNSQCPECDRSLVIPLQLATTSDQHNSYFCCEGCGANWVA